MNNIDMADTGCHFSDVRGLLAQRERDFQELNHRVANSLQLAASFLALQQKSVDDIRARDALERAQMRLMAIGELHRYFYLQDGDARVDLVAFLGGICPMIAEVSGLDFEISVDPFIVPAETAQQLAIAVSELATNAAKYAYPNGKGQLAVKCTRLSHGLSLVVVDNGPGLGEDFKSKGGKGTGLKIVAGIASRLGGTFVAATDNGAKFTLTIPLS